MDTVLAPGGDLPDLPVPQVALLSGPAGVVPSSAQAAGGITVSAAASSSPSQERLVRIASMIRDAERAMPERDRHERRRQVAGPVPLFTRRPARSSARARTAA
ncbi:MAG: hypothetical protein JWQ99_359 [Blastococcus sp.]|nr:hypothetical protein [Blastococcus sp.]